MFSLANNSAMGCKFLPVDGKFAITYCRIIMQQVFSMLFLVLSLHLMISCFAAMLKISFAVKFGSFLQ
jgi:hypothetical protein